MKWLVSALVAVGLAAPAHALEWTVDPAHIPWETLSSVPDAGREPARTFEAITDRMTAVQEQLADGTLTREARAAALVEMADLFRDEARLVIEEEFLSEPRILLPTSPAWLQLELALKWYDEARAEDPTAADPEGRVTLLRAVTRARLLMEAETFSSYAQVIRTYRRSPYADIAKLAVGDHHFRHGDIDRAKSAYKLVRNHQVPELAAYARYRLAHVEAAEDDTDRAIAVLEDLLAGPQTTPLERMVVDASRFSLANLIAPRMELVDLLRWANAACVEATPRCVGELREAASDGLRTAGLLGSAAWIEEIDPLLAELVDSPARFELAELAAPGAEPLQVLRSLLDVCPADDDACRADIAHATASFYEESERPEGGWLREFERLPKFRGRPDLDLALGEVARTAQPAAEALPRLTEMCGDAGCKDIVRLHLLRYYETSWRAHDARWIRWYTTPPRVPDVPDAVIAAAVQAHVSASEMLAAVRPHCAPEGCGMAVLEPLAAYYHDIGEQGDARWLRALATVPSSGRASVDALVASVARADEGALKAIQRIPEACPADPACAADALVALEGYYVGAARPREIAWLAPLRDLASNSELLLGILEVAAAESEPGPALVLLEGTCPAGDLACSGQRRAALVAWYRHLGRPLAAAAVPTLPSVPGRPDPTEALQAALAAGLGPTEAVDEVVQPCAADAACAREAIAALADAFDAAGRPADANAARTRR